MAAACNGHMDIVTVLLAAGAPWNAFDRQANCAGDYALLNGHAECVEVLLNAGASHAGNFDAECVTCRVFLQLLGHIMVLAHLQPLMQCPATVQAGLWCCSRAAHAFPC